MLPKIFLCLIIASSINAYLECDEFNSLLIEINVVIKLKYEQSLLCSKFLEKGKAKNRSTRGQELVCSDFLRCVLPRGFLDKREAARSLFLNSLDSDSKIELLKNVCIFREAFILDSRVYVVSSKVIHCKLPVWEVSIMHVYSSQCLLIKGLVKKQWGVGRGGEIESTRPNPSIWH